MYRSYRCCFSPSQIGISVTLVLLQMEICMNDFRTNPSKYRAAVASSCDFDAAMAPLLSDGYRLPLKGTGDAATAALDLCDP